MNLELASQLRRAAGKGGAACCLLFFMVILDAIISQARQPVNVLELLPGSSEHFNVSLKEYVEGPGELIWQSSSEHIRASFESVHKGFWLGQYMCRGIIRLSPDIRTGEYTFSVALKNSPAKPFFTYRIKIYPDADTLRQHSKSVIVRTVGISPWRIVAILPLLILTSVVLSFWLSVKKEALMAQAGKAEIWQVKTAEGGDRIAFGLGNRHGIEPGMKLNLSDARGNPVSEIVVSEVSEKDASALVSSGLSVRPGYVVSKAVLRNTEKPM